MRRVAQIVLVAIAGVSSHPLAAQVRAPWQKPPSDFGGAVPKNEGKWLTFEDYPMSALQKNEQGLVVVSFVIRADGKVGDCQVTQSSGHRTLDDVPCALLKQRARFQPATDANGAAVATHGTTGFVFWMPRGAR